VRKQINEYVEDRTKGLIKEVLQQDLDKDTVLALINTLYFNGTWRNEFKPRDFLALKFNDGCPGIETDQAKWMGVTKRYMYKDSTTLDAKMIELPYRSRKGGEASMVIVMPNQKCKMQEWLNKFEWSDFKNEYAAMENKFVEIALPKFALQSRYELQDILPKMGMSKAFSRTAEFPKILEDETQKIRIDQVIHQTKMDVTEAGTEAAAATVITMTRLSASFPREPPITLNIDRSFYAILILRNNATDRSNILPLFNAVVNTV